MSGTTPLIIVGAGGLGLEALWVAEAMNAVEEQWEVLGYVDDRAELVGAEHYGTPVIGLTSDVGGPLGRGAHVHIAVGTNKQRAAVARMMDERGVPAATLIHPKSAIAPTARIGEGSYVGAFAVVAPFASVGRHTIINVQAVVGHEAQVGDFAQIGPGAVATGGCTLGVGCFLGSNASMNPGRTAADYATVAANSFAVADVADEQTVIGIPARAMYRQ